MSEQVTSKNNLNLIRKLQFTPELKQLLKHMAHTIYDELYHAAYVQDWPTEDTSDAQFDFEWRWLRRVTEPLLLGYATARPHDNTDDMRNALREVGFLFSQQVGWHERDDYDDVEQQCFDAFDWVFAQVHSAARIDAYLRQVNGVPVLRVEDAHTRKAFDLLTRDQVLGLPITDARTQLTDICLRRGADEAVTQALTAGGFTVHTDDPFS